MDARAGDVIESLLVNLKSRCTLLMVSHYMDQVKRIADECLRISGTGLRSGG
jgi:phosphate transport system ATP-binding protein